MRRLRGRGLKGGEDAVGDGGCFGGGADVVDAEDVGSGEDGGGVGGGRGVEAWGTRIFSGPGEETFAGETSEDGLMQLVEGVKVSEERIVFIEALAEAEAGVEDDLVVRDACGGGGFEAVAKASEDERENFVRGERRLVRPRLRAASGVHEDGSAA
jgi:hypothetical protein